MAAGLGFKDFVTGEVLTAADVDGYLMQGVWVFASAAARDSAVTSPQEGNFAYLKDTNVTTYYTGSAWANLDTTGMTNPMTTTGDTIYSSSGSTPARLGIGTSGQVLTVSGGGVPSWATPAGGGGKVLQVVEGTKTAFFNMSSTTYADVGLSVSITPSSASSKIYVMTTLSAVGKNGGNANTTVLARLLRDSTSIFFASDRIGYTNTSVINNIGSVVLNKLDSPSTTSAITYKAQIASFVSGQGVWINDYSSNDTAISTIIAMEIGA
jgi:hypothetical protein